MQTTDQPSAIVICVSRNLLFLSRPYNATQVSAKHGVRYSDPNAPSVCCFTRFTASSMVLQQKTRQASNGVHTIRAYESAITTTSHRWFNRTRKYSNSQARERESLSRAQTLRSCAKLRAWCSTSDSNSFAVKVSNTTTTAGSINHHPIQATYSRSTT